MFHEFGHALHGLFNAQKYTGLGAARDWVEFPSQFNEHWALEPEVLKNYALHYQTGAPIPQALVDKIKTSQTWTRAMPWANCWRHPNWTCNGISSLPTRSPPMWMPSRTRR